MVAFDDIDVPWPQKGDDPLAIGEHSRLVAGVNFSFDEPWGQIAEGFKRLGDLGVASLEQTGHGHNYLVYPILFSYRHFIESVAQGDHPRRSPPPRRAGVGAADPQPRTLVEYGRTTPDGVRAGHRAHIQRRSRLSRSVRRDRPHLRAFRYPVKHNGGNALPDALRTLDLDQVRQVVERLAAFLDAAAMQTSVYLDYKVEMEATYRDYV